MYSINIYTFDILMYKHIYSNLVSVTLQEYNIIIYDLVIYCNIITLHNMI